MRTHTMNDGREIPQIGLGTYGLRGAAGEAQISEAIRFGYRLIDTAVRYENEEVVGRAVRYCGVDRDDLFVTSKIPGNAHGMRSAVEAVKGSLSRTGLDYLDLALIHWPNPSQGKFVQAWEGLIHAREQGLVKSIGVSNFLPEHLQQIVAETGVKPVLNQVELNPFFQREELTRFHAENSIITECWTPLGRKSDLLSSPTVLEIAREVHATPAQVVLRWAVQKNFLPIPKTSQLKRAQENLLVFSWELSEEHMEQLRMLETGISGFGFDPTTHEEY
ncbi:aldo/keto reductase [Rothia sp. LK2588]|uniref:aldo/keto reductase n=1 Tax=Rothia sp. LK2588 TaxID=3114369 RepID=UPI0034CFA84A